MSLPPDPIRVKSSVLVRLRELQEKATAPQWKKAYWPNPEPHWWIGQRNPDFLSSKLGPKITGPISNEANANLIVEAVNALPLLLEVAEAAEALQVDYDDGLFVGELWGRLRVALARLEETQ